MYVLSRLRENVFQKYRDMKAKMKDFLYIGWKGGVKTGSKRRFRITNLTNGKTHRHLPIVLPDGIRVSIHPLLA